MYCVYFTLYFGEKLPRRYLGSSTVKRVLSGYNGSIKSKAYHTVYREEQIKNKHLFKTRILSLHSLRNEALIEELRLQIKYKMSYSKLYMNMSRAVVNGCFGRDVAGSKHPMIGKKQTEHSRKKISDSLKLLYENGSIMSPFAKMSHVGELNGFYGKKHMEESKIKMRKPKRYVPKFICNCCAKVYDTGNLKQHLRRKGFSDEYYEENKLNNKFLGEEK